MRTLFCGLNWAPLSCKWILTPWYTLWQYGLWSFQAGGTKLKRILPKNQHPQKKLLNLENWISGGLRSFRFKSQLFSSSLSI